MYEQFFVDCFSCKTLNTNTRQTSQAKKERTNQPNNQPHNQATDKQTNEQNERTNEQTKMWKVQKVMLTKILTKPAHANSELRLCYAARAPTDRASTHSPVKGARTLSHNHNPKHSLFGRQGKSVPTQHQRYVR